MREVGSRAWVLWVMLGISPYQKELEHLHAIHCGKGELLANSCLSFFGQQTGISIKDRKVVFRSSALRLQIGQYRAVSARSKSNAGSIYTYRPSYWMLSGYDFQTGKFSEEIFATGRKKLVAAVLSDFWAAVKSYPYLPSELLKSSFSPKLENYLLNGVQLDSNFCPSTESISLYLHGAAGTGKSTFVSACAAALQSSLQRHLDHDREVKVVKVPLNSITDWQLKSILTVQVLEPLSLNR